MYIYVTICIITLMYYLSNSDAYLQNEKGIWKTCVRIIFLENAYNSLFDYIYDFFFVLKMINIYLY